MSIEDFFIWFAALALAAVVAGPWLVGVVTAVVRRREVVLNGHADAREDEAQRVAVFVVDKSLPVAQTRDAATAAPRRNGR